MLAIKKKITFQLLLCLNSFPDKPRNEWDKEVCSRGLFVLGGDGLANACALLQLPKIVNNPTELI